MSSQGQPPSDFGDFIFGRSPFGGPADTGPPGPPYPPTPSGSNAIGLFQIGKSPIGTIPPFNVWSTIIAQYANSPVLYSLITSWFAALDLTQITDDFYDKVFNVATAVGYGLDVWGRIVGVSRNLNVSAGSFFGYNEAIAGGGITGFGQAPFYSGGALTTNFSLSDQNYRTLIFAKALFNICNGSILAVNKILLNLFAPKQCYVQDNRDFTMAYVFNFQPTPLQSAIIFQSGVLPKAAGVKATVVINP